MLSRGGTGGENEGVRDDIPTSSQRWSKPALGRRSPQASLFDGDQIYLDHVGRNTFYAFLARVRHRLFRDEDFAGL